VELAGRYACLDLKLTPLGAYTLLHGLPLSELAGAVHPLEDVLGHDGRRLEEQLAGAGDGPERFAILESFLLARNAEGPTPDPAVARAWSRLCQSEGRASVGALARELRCSRRYLGSRFREQVGQPPKTVARLLRFERACRLIRAEPARLADIAIDCGYYDQSHLNRDFRDLAGTTAGQFTELAMRSGSSRAT
jgi:AraC-like DNA-binding protein